MSSRQIDPNTGMPKLPHGWRWKIKRWGYMGGTAVEVFLHQRRFGIWWVRGSSVADPTPEEILVAANRCLDQRDATHPWLTPDEKKYLGTYPPKRLEDR